MEMLRNNNFVVLYIVTWTYVTLWLTLSSAMPFNSLFYILVKNTSEQQQKELEGTRIVL